MSLQMYYFPNIYGAHEIVRVSSIILYYIFFNIYKYNEIWIFYRNLVKIIRIVL